MIHSIESDEHIRDTISVLEEALVDARRGYLSGVVVFGDVRGENLLKTYKTGYTNRILLLGKLIHAVFELCCEYVPGKMGGA